MDNSLTLVTPLAQSVIWPLISEADNNRQTAIYAARERRGQIYDPIERVPVNATVNLATGEGTGGKCFGIDPVYLAGRHAYTTMKVLGSQVIGQGYNRQRIYRVAIDNQDEVLMSESLIVKHFQEHLIPEPAIVQQGGTLRALLGNEYLHVDVAWTGMRDEIVGTLGIEMARRANESLVNTQQHQRVYLLAFAGEFIGFFNQEEIEWWKQQPCKAFIKSVYYRQADGPNKGCWCASLVFCGKGEIGLISETLRDQRLAPLLAAAPQAKPEQLAVGQYFKRQGVWFAIVESQLTSSGKQYRLWRSDYPELPISSWWGERDVLENLA